MAKVTGIVKVFVNGSLLRSKEGAELDVGGMERTAQVGHSLYGFTEKVMPAVVTFEVANMDGDDLVELGKTVEATVRFDCDAGGTYLVNNAFVSKPPKLKGGDGTVSVEMQGDPALKE
jgi:hypothetical protein